MRLPTNVDFDSPSGPSRALEYHRPDGGQNKDDSSVRKKKKKRKRRKIVASIYYIVPDGRRKRLLRERFRIDLVMLRDGPRLHHSGKLGLLDEDQPLLHVFLAPLHLPLHLSSLPARSSPRFAFAHFPDEACKFRRCARGDVLLADDMVGD